MVDNSKNGVAWVGLVVSICIAGVAIFVNVKHNDRIKDIFVSFGIGIVFALGLLIAGFGRRSKVLGFLSVQKNWDPALMFGFAGAVLPAILTYNIILKRSGPYMDGSFDYDDNDDHVNGNLILGCVCFGLGWGICGCEIGAGVLGAAIYFP